MSKVLMDTNEVFVSGTIVGIYETDRIKSLTVGVTKARTKKGFLSNYPRIVFFKDKDGKTPADDFEKLDRVEISGKLRSRKIRIEDEDGNKKYSFTKQSIIGETIKAAASSQDGDRVIYEKPKADFNITGTVVESANMNGGAIRVFVRNNENENRYNRLAFVLFPDNFEKAAKELTPGTKVHLCGDFQTGTFKRDDQDIRSESAFIRQYARI